MTDFFSEEWAKKRAEIAESVFAVSFDKLPGGDPRHDADKVRQEFDNIRKVAAAKNISLANDPELKKIAEDWLTLAKSADVDLGYTTIEERFSGKHASYLASEAAVFEKLVTKQPLSEDRKEHPPKLLATAGAPGAGKSRLLSETAPKLLRSDSMLSDPDEAILEKLGPYLWLRAAARKVMEKGANTISAGDIDAQITQKNEWRIPPYNLFRAASNAINTMATAIAIKQGRDVAFGWTGIKGYGLDVLIKKGYMAAGYAAHYLYVFAEPETLKRLELKRDRPANPGDFDTKPANSMAAMPQVLATASQADFYITNIDKPAQLAYSMSLPNGERPGAAPFKASPTFGDDVRWIVRLIEAQYQKASPDNRPALNAVTGAIRNRGFTHLGVGS